MRCRFLVGLAVLMVGCGHSHGVSGGSSFASNHSGGFSSHSSSYGGSHASSSVSHASSSTSYETRVPGPAARPVAPRSVGAPASPGARGSSGDSDTASEVVQAVGAALLNAVVQAGSDSSSSGADAQTPTRPETACETQLRQWREMHPDGGVKVPPQLRCGPNGEWGGERPAARNP
jgi:hypothetical protein